MNIVVKEFNSKTETEAVDSIFGHSSGAAKGRARLSVGDKDYWIAAEESKPFFSCFYIAIEQSGKQYWLNINSLKKRLSASGEGIKILKKYFPNEKKLDIVPVAISELKTAIQRCRKNNAPDFTDEQIFDIYKACQGPFKGKNPILIRGKSNKIERSILISAPDAKGKRKRYLLMTHVKRGNDKKIGQGSFGKVRFAVDLDDLSVKALKICRKDKSPMNDPEKEAAIMLAFQGKEGVLQLEESLKVGNKIYMVLEYCNHPDLFNSLLEKTKTPLVKGDVLPLIRDMAAGLAAIHEAGIVHRDLKEENVFLTHTDRLRAKIGDFGYAKRGLKGPTEINGTPDFWSPQKCKILFDKDTKEVSQLKEDMWSLGLIFYRMAHPKLYSLTPAFDSTRETIHAYMIRQRNLSQETINQRIEKSGIDPGLQAILRQMLVLDETQGAPSMREIVTQIDALMASSIAT